MGSKLKAEGDIWRAVPGGPSSRSGHRNVVFFCESNGQRPYRVVEVPDDGSDPEAYVGGEGSAKDRFEPLDQPEFADV